MEAIKAEHTVAFRYPFFSSLSLSLSFLVSGTHERVACEAAVVTVTFVIEQRLLRAPLHP